MEVFKELKIYVPRAHVPSYIESISKIEGNWVRASDSDIESLIGNDQQYCFEFKESASIVQVRLWLCENDEKSIYVTNIVPNIKSSLTKKEYNYYIDDFLKEKIVKGGFKYEITKNIIGISDLLSEECARKFESFSKLANKSTGSSHPSDKKRWLQFIICTQSSDKKINADQVEELLIEYGWDKERAFDLKLEFEFGKDILDEYLLCT